MRSIKNGSVFQQAQKQMGKRIFNRKMKRRTKTEGKSHKKKFAKWKIFHAVELFGSSGIIPRWLRDSAGI
jgi:hypothetical protein